MLKISRFRDKVLFQKAAAVKDDEYGPELEKVLSDMGTTMYTSRGVGLAGPQVGDSRRLIVADLGYVDSSDYGSNLIKMVNPEVISFSEEEAKAEEGCLSYPGLAVKVSRPLAINVKFYSPSGVEQNQTFNGWQARIIMHEIDHLNGVTLFSRASNLKRSRYEKKIKKLDFK